MVSAVIILTLACAAVTAYLLVSPHFAEEAAAKAVLSEQSQVLNEQRERCLQVLKDLELDYHTGKISEADYRAMKLGTSQELSSILKSIDEHSQSHR